MVRCTQVFIVLCLGLGLSACAGNFQTPDFVRSYSGFTHKNISFEGDYQAAIKRIQARADECLNRRFRSTGNYRRGSVGMTVDYTPTLQIGETHTQLHVQKKHVDMIMLGEEPAKGSYVLIADLYKRDGNRLDASFHYSPGIAGLGSFGSYADAIEGWMRGTHSLCPKHTLGTSP